MSAEPLPARDDGARRRVLRLRQRRLDGHLHGQQRRRPTSTQPTTPLKNALYKNNRDGTFTDVTDKAGVAGGKEFGMGCAIADYDNDGYPDILVTAYGRCTLYHNNGNGTFTDVTDKTGRRVRPAGRRAPSGSTTTTTASSICSSAASSSSRCKSNVFCGDNKLGQALLLHPARLQADAERCSTTTTATARSPRSARAPTSSTRSARRSASSPPTSTTTA